MSFLVKNDAAFEREMTRHERGMVDTCFEEGHYEAGIDILEKLRTQNFRPSCSHIRQLIYIALVPPDISKDKGRGKDVFGSPSKIPTSKQSKTSLPTPAASAAAVVLLKAFQATYPPESLLRALPSYALSEADSPVKSGVNMEMDDPGDSFVAREAAILTECQDCWSMMKGGLVKRPDDVKWKGHEPVKTRARRGASHSDEETGEDDSHYSAGEIFWPLLDWIIVLFEEDEARANGRHPALLSQIKPPRTGMGPRWDVEAPIDIIFICYKQTESRRVALGARLMTLLINLTRDPLFSSQQLMTLTASRLRGLTHDTMAAFLENIPGDSRGLAFACSICARYLTEVSSSSGGAKSLPRPQARRARQLNTSPERRTSFPAAPEIPTNTLVAQYPWPMPTASQIHQYLNSDKKAAQGSLSHSFIKCHLFCKFGCIKVLEFEQTGVADEGWIQVLSDNMLPQKLSDWLAFETRDEVEKQKNTSMQDHLLPMVTQWKNAICRSSK